MSKPRIHVRGKGTSSALWEKKADPLNWTAHEEEAASRQHDRARRDDYWSAYIKKRKRKRPAPVRRKPGVKRRRHAHITPKDTAKHSLLKIVTSGGSAVLAGTLMGLIILKMGLGGETPERTHTIDRHIEEAALSENEKTAESEGGAFQLPELNTVWVQGGVYSSEDAAEEAAKAHRAEERAAIVKEEDGQHRVFLGMAMSNEDALHIASHIEADGADAYLKENLIAAAGPMSDLPPPQGQKVAEIASTGQSIVSDLAALSAAGMSGEEGSDRASRQADSAGQAYSSFLATAGALKKELSGSRREALEAMDEALAKAMRAAEQYRENGSSSHLWQVQEGMMEYVMAYEQMLAASTE